MSEEILTSMDEKAYLRDRVDDQLNWLEKKSGESKRHYRRFKTVTIVVAVLIPFLTGLIDGEITGLMKIVVGLLGVVIAVSEGIPSLNKYHDLWIRYRATAEAVKREKIIYLTKSGKYEKATDPFRAFVVEIESILAEENSKWLEFIAEKDGGNNG